MQNRLEEMRRHNRNRILDEVASGAIKPEDAAKLLRLGRKPPRFVVTQNGSIALYNLHKTPIIMYADQWEKLESLIRRDILDNYIARNENIIKRRVRRPSPGPDTDDCPEYPETDVYPEAAPSESCCQDGHCTELPY